MKDTALISTRRGFLKMAASITAAIDGGEGRNFGQAPWSKFGASSHLAWAHTAPAVEREPKLDRAVLTRALNSACDWMTGVAQMKTDALSGEQNSHQLEHHHWRGALRGEYRASTRQWDFFCPVWHSGQAVKSLVWAAQAFNRPGLLDSARLAAGLLISKKI